MRGDADPGVPEALPRILRAVAERLGAETLDRLWIFPPVVRGRREWGLVTVSRYEAPAPEDADEVAEGRDRRRLYTAAYSAERTGRGLVVEPVLSEEGTAPLDRLPRVMDGVVRRSGDQRGEPREVAIAGDPDTFATLVAEYDAALPEEGSSPENP
ncbi:MAG TPA: hypothetical protein VE173_10685 [Longimicrobiales bacterium]|nr:hypothetical protein [Longimicrobiales bacterium]